MIEYILKFNYNTFYNKINNEPNEFVTLDKFIKILFESYNSNNYENIDTKYFLNTLISDRNYCRDNFEPDDIRLDSIDLLLNYLFFKTIDDDTSRNEIKNNLINLWNKIKNKIDSILVIEEL